MDRPLNPRLAPKIIRSFTIFVFAIGFCAVLFSGWVPSFSSNTANVADEIRPGFDAIQVQDLKAYLKFIASDELEGRDTGSRGLKLAALFLVSQYRLAGLTPVPGKDSMLQSFEVINNRIDDTTKLIVATAQGEHDFGLFSDFAVLSQHASDIDAEFPVYFLGYGYRDEQGMHDDFNDDNLQGKVVLVLDSTPELDNDLRTPERDAKIRAERKKKNEWAQAAGAAGILHISTALDDRTMARLDHYLSRYRQHLAVSEPDIPQLLATPDVANALLATSGWQLDSLRAQVRAGAGPGHFILENVKLKLALRTQAEVLTTQNVVAYLEGSDPVLKHEVVAFGAHYDHVGVGEDGQIYNGADDDGSGTTALLAIARAFANNPIRPKRSLLFVAHAGEEKGLLGSEYYTDHPLVPLDSTVVQLNVDMVGRNDPNAVYIIGSNFLSLELHEINESANGFVGMKLDYGYNTLADPERFYYRSDHYNYAKHGIPIIFYFSGTHVDYHKPTDTVEKIDFHKIQKVARLVYLTGWQVANLGHRLSQDGLLLKKRKR